HIPSEPVEVIVERTRDRRHGDYASNVALLLGKAAGTAPRALAGRIVAALPVTEQVQRVEIAGPGFINFFLSAHCLHAALRRALVEANGFGTSRLGGGTPIQVEFVSANPTGPLHIGHGRGAAYGAVIANLLAAVGYAVHREYYVNDAGRQMDILALSVWLRYLEQCGDRIPFPDHAYRGAYVRDIAAALRAAEGERLRRPVHAVLKGDVNELPPDAELDAAIASLKRALGTEDYRRLHDHGLNDVLDGIRKDLADFGVDYQEWFSERSLREDGSVERAIERLRALNRTYVKDGALWFNAVAYGDEKDRVLVRENGHSTYFASDVAYHLHKLERGFQFLIDLWGADHHGYMPRVRAALAAVGEDPGRLEVRLVQFATLFRGKERVQMSTRSGEFVTLRELVDEVGRDAARFFYVTRRSDQ
ncbi:MAG: arginine--tRNA ligase, partial [Terriglobales bacterium]